MTTKEEYRAQQVLYMKEKCSMAYEISSSISDNPESPMRIECFKMILEYLLSDRRLIL
jgi:hypothetical protein